jgi:phosphoenolpyruvate synthase/pyruvate phosphate dikinase
VPLSLPPVAGVLTEQPSTALSHINLLVKGWGVPNAYVQDAFQALKPWDGRWVHLRVDRAGYEVTPADRPDRLPPRPRAASVRSPDLSQSAVLPLTALDRSAMPRCGGKAAVLGQVEAWRRAGRLPGTAPVPDGFCIPFGAYAAFIHQPAVAQRIAQALQTPRFDRSAAIRRQALDALRRDLVEQPFDARQEAAWVAQWQQQLGGAGVFVRSSSNSEDLANFSGAGLYTTVPNVKAEADLAKAVRTVWASVFNADAFEARRAAGIALDQVAMAVFVQRAVDSVNAGVMVTRDPFDATHLRVVYVSAKRGIGIKVVEGQRVAEQSMFDLRSHAVRRLSRSAEASELKLDASGGVSERPIEAGAPVLSDAMVERLSRVAWQIRTLMRGVEQDIEWAIDPQGRIVVLQARPYIERHSL